MKPKSSKFLAGDVSNYLWYLKLWSFTGFQRFLESGVISHMAEAVKAGTGKITPAFERRIGRWSSISENIDGVSSGQLQKFFLLIPGNIAEKEEFWEGFGIWSCYSALWDDHVPDWLELEDWREDMGLPRINPLVSNGELTVVFRRVGNGRPLKLPEGYRYACPDDLAKVETPSGSLPIVLNVQGIWGFDFGPQLEKLSDPDRFFHDYVVYVPIVELGGA